MGSLLAIRHDSLWKVKSLSISLFFLNIDLKLFNLGESFILLGSMFQSTGQKEGLN
jgi:hypothetical protein